MGKDQERPISEKPGWKWEGRIFCDSVFFSPLQVTSDPVFLIPDLVTSLKGALRLGSVSPNTNKKGRNTDGRIRKVGRLGKKRELGNPVGIPRNCDLHPHPGAVAAPQLGSIREAP